MEFDQVVVGEINTDVDECYECNQEIDHNCVQMSNDVDDLYFHTYCYMRIKHKYNPRQWKVTRFVLNAKDK